ncbi:efflux RND transporter periplasmic adaptor subunit [Myroides guanonis]|uniref:Membrane fusion protein, cobalt-zinc-cadmium efflux system n=1 Tax=Myroides guanonis TaxID=1150112 RepID=A0A1I3SP54_9FLAO|nr:efflux RND transporter periplasmic adaptor subunit [Myroides guanonis]SFJ60170.1 membrane fusion protein, cobalt-zinc-cadmium efflux system [Myroides guanonis]
MLKKKILFFGLIAVLSISCKKGSSVSTPTTLAPYCIPQALKDELQFEKIKKQKVEQTLTLSGTIQYNDNKTIPFVSLQDGVITQTYFSLGDFVKKGQLLAELKSSSLNEMSDQIRGLKSQIEVAKRNYTATLEMFNDGISSQKELIEAQSDLEVLKSNLITLESNMDLYSANESKSVFQVKSPSDGYIVSKDINPGMSIQAGESTLFTVANLDEVWIMANIYASYAPLVHTNQTVKIKTLAHPNTYFEGKISFVSQVFDEEERVLKARIVMSNQEGKLKPGMSADVILNIEATNEEAIAIPMEAIIFDNNQSYVVIYQDDCNQEVRLVDSVAKNELYMYATNNFKEDEVVITTNELLIFEELNSRKK